MELCAAKIEAKLIGIAKIVGPTGRKPFCLFTDVLVKFKGELLTSFVVLLLLFLMVLLLLLLLL